MRENIRIAEERISAEEYIDFLKRLNIYHSLKKVKIKYTIFLTIFLTGNSIV